jgi:hypothetical protein
VSRPGDDRGATARGLVRLAATLALGAVGVALLVQQSRDATRTAGRGLDFAPLRGAAQALLHGLSIYSVHRFVYPPTAAVALLPVTLGSPHDALDAWLALGAASVALAALLALCPWRGGWWPAAAALGACALLNSDALTGTLWLGNLTLLLAPVAVGVLACFEAGRWRAGLALLVLSLLIKPLLAPLLLLPLLCGRRRELAAALGGGVVLLGVAILAVPGGGHFFSVLGFLEGGSSLHGAEAVYNISLRGLGERLHAGGWIAAARLAVVAVAVAVAALATRRWARRDDVPGDLAATGTLLLLAFMLAGSLSEDHYLLVVAACTLATLGAREDVLAALAALPGLALVVVPRHWLGGVAGSPDALQVRWILAELLLAAAALAVLVAGPSVRAGGSARRLRWTSFAA